jgi:selT/selW/selH-like putative selenoprotein
VILEEAKDAEVTIEVGRTSSFEVTLNGTLVYSKLETNTFPDEQVIADKVADIVEGK